MNHINETAEILRTWDAAIGRMFGNDLRAAHTAYEAHRSYAERVARAEAALRDEFLALARKGELDAVAPFAQPVPDWANRPAVGPTPKRPATLLDVIEDAVDFQDYSRQLMALFVRAANGSQVGEDARELMGKLAAKYAYMNTEDVE